MQIDKLKFQFTKTKRSCFLQINSKNIKLNIKIWEIFIRLDKQILDTWTEHQTTYLCSNPRMKCICKSVMMMIFDCRIVSICDNDDWWGLCHPLCQAPGWWCWHLTHYFHITQSLSHTESSSSVLFMLQQHFEEEAPNIYLLSILCFVQERLKKS